MNRDESLDVLKGIGITLMIFNHVYFGGLVHHYVQSFHMPLFFIASGYLWKNKGESWHEHIHYKLKKLAIPYFFWGSLFCLIWSVSNVVMHSGENILEGWLKLLLFSTNGIPYAGAIWYLASFFWCELLYYTVKRIFKSNLECTIVFIIIAIGGCIISGLFVIDIIPWGIEPALTGCMFMNIGEILRKTVIPNRNVLDMNKRVFPIIVFAQVLMAFINPTIDMRTSRYCIVPLYFINGILGTIVWWNISNILLKSHMAIINKITDALKYISRFSIVFLCTNSFLTTIAKKVADYGSGGNILIELILKLILWIVVMMICWGICEFMSKGRRKILIGR